MHIEFDDNEEMDILYQVISKLINNDFTVSKQGYKLKLVFELKGYNAYEAQVSITDTHPNSAFKIDRLRSSIPPRFARLLQRLASDNEKVLKHWRKIQRKIAEERHA